MDNLITVKFINSICSKEYVFKNFNDVKIGDLVVVDTANGMAIAEVTKLTGELLNGKVLNEVVDVIDVTAFNARKEKANKIKKLKSKMDKRVKELQNIAIYEALAKEDTELADLLTELKNLM